MRRAIPLNPERRALDATRASSTQSTQANRAGWGTRRAELAERLASVSYRWLQLLLLADSLAAGFAILRQLVPLPRVYPPLRAKKKCHLPIARSDGLEIRWNALAVALRSGVERMVVRLPLPLSVTRSACGPVPEDPLDIRGDTASGAITTTCVRGVGTHGPGLDPAAEPFLSKASDAGPRSCRGGSRQRTSPYGNLLAPATTCAGPRPGPDRSRIESSAWLPQTKYTVRTGECKPTDSVEDANIKGRSNDRQEREGIEDSEEVSTVERGGSGEGECGSPRSPASLRSLPPEFNAAQRAGAITSAMTGV